MTDDLTGPDPDDETRRLMAAADPAATLPPIAPDRWAALLEDAMTQHDPETRPGRRPSARLLGGVLAAAVVLGVAALGIRAWSDDDNPAEPSVLRAGGPATPGTTGPGAGGTVTELRAGPGASAKCLPPDAAAIAAQDIAFKGIVTSVSADTVTLRVETFYRGRPTDRVTVARPDLGTTELPVDFQDGETYLVGATDGQVSICGLAGLATPSLQQLYDQAFGR